MSTFPSNVVFILLTPISIKVFARKGDVPSLTFSPEIFEHQEIKNEQEFEKQLEDYFKKFGKQNCVIFISQELLYQKVFPLDPKTHQPNETDIESFLDSIPVTSHQIAKKYILTPHGLAVITTNNKLYTSVITASEKALANISFVLPLSVFDEITNNQPFSFQIGKKIEENTKLVTIANFLTENDYEKKNIKEEENDEGEKITPRQYMIFAISLLFFFGAIIFAVVQLGFIPLSSKQNPKPLLNLQQPTPLPSIIVTTTPASTSAVLTKDHIKIQILNGSGIAGQAGTVKDELIAAGFTNIETGNAEGSNSNTTIAIFSNTVSETVKNEILAKLNNIFTKIDTQQIPSSETFDVFITTGQGIK